MMTDSLTTTTETSGGATAEVDYLVPIDPMDELHCESCQ